MLYIRGTTISDRKMSHTREPIIHTFSCNQAALRTLLSVHPSVCLFFHPSACYTFFTMFLSSYHDEMFKSYSHGQTTGAQQPKISSVWCQNWLFWSTFACHNNFRLCATRTTRRSENDDTPQPLDQWTNSPFIGQQVENWSICHALWPIRKPIVHPTLYPTHISFIPSQSNFPFLKYGY